MKEEKITIFSSEGKVTIKIEKPNNMCYQDSFTLQRLAELSNFFLSFKSIEEVTEGLKYQIKSQHYTLKEDRGKIILGFNFFNRLISIALPLNSSLKEIQTLQDKITNITKKIIGYRSIVYNLNNKLRKTNITLKNEKLKFRSIFTEVLKDTFKGDFHWGGYQTKEKEEFKVSKENDFALSSKLKCIEVLTPHTQRINCVCSINDKKFATCSKDKLIKIFDKKTCKCLYELKGHTGEVKYIEKLENNQLISCGGFGDFTVKIWELYENSGIILRNLTTCHKNGITKAIVLDDKKIITCSFDGTIQLYSDTNSYIKSLEMHEGSVISLIDVKNKGMIVSAECNGLLCFWRKGGFELIQHLSSIRCDWSNSMMQVDPSTLIVCGGSKVCIIELHTLTLQKVITFKGLTRVDSVIKLTNDKILCGCLVDDSYSFIRISLVESCVLDVHQNTHQENIYGLLILDDKRLLSCGNEGVIKIWE